MSRRNGFAIVLAASLSLLLVLGLGCGQKTEVDQSTQTTMAPTESTTVAPPAVADATGPPDTAMTDGAIEGVLIAANESEIEDAKLARSASHNDAVLAYATQMQQDHSSVNVKTRELASRIGVKIQESDVSRSLAGDAASKRNELKNMSGEPFDRAFMDNAVAQQQAVIDMLDNNLMPRAQNPDLKALLVSVRPSLLQHLEHAKTVQSRLVPS